MSYQEWETVRKQKEEAIVNKLIELTIANQLKWENLVTDYKGYRVNCCPDDLIHITNRKGSTICIYDEPLVKKLFNVTYNKDQEDALNNIHNALME